MPLVPLGLIGWANGLGDRYLIGGLLGVTEAGVYAAAYGLASRPLLMLGGTIELFVRPIYQSAVSAADHSKASRVLLMWFAAVIGAGAMSVLLIAVLRDELARLLLGAQYRSGAELMPWIAGGYMLLTIAQVFERICYAHARERLAYCRFRQSPRWPQLLQLRAASSSGASQVRPWPCQLISRCR